MLKIIKVYKVIEISAKKATEQHDYDRSIKYSILFVKYALYSCKRMFEKKLQENDQIRFYDLLDHKFEYFSPKNELATSE